MTEVSLGAHDCTELLDILLHRAIDDGVAVVAPAFHFLGGVAHADLDLLLRFGTAPQESATEFLKIGRQEKDVGQCPEDKRVAAGADIRGAVCVDIEQHIDSVAEILQHGPLERSVVIAVHLGIFQELAVGEPGSKILRR